jgi:hypothetical protein
MNTKTLLFLALALFSTSALSAEMAKIIRMTGTQDVVVTLPDGRSVAGAAGLEMPVDSLIEVKAGTRLFFKTFEGQITVVESDSVIFLETIEVTSAGKEKTVVELKSGNLVANLDPTKRGTNDYGVRTPKGVAAARGTNYTVSVNGQNVVVSVVAGVVSINIPNLVGGGVTSVALNPGQASADGGAAQSIASVLTTTATSTPAQVAAAATTRIALQAAAAVVATLAADPTSGVTTATLSAVVGTASQAASASGDNGLVALVAATATQANPSQAAAIVTAAVTAAPAAATNIVASVTQEVVASQESTASGSSNAAATAATLSQAANDTGTTENPVNVDANTVTNAVAPTAPNTPTTPTTPAATETEVEVEIEVPTDNTILRIDTSFTIQLSGGRLVAVGLNSVDNTVTTQLVTTAQGPVTAQVGDGASTAFTVPAGVATALGDPVSAQQLTAIQVSLTTLLNGPVITVPNNTIVVSPSS